jgi:hypothetical protein
MGRSLAAVVFAVALALSLSPHVTLAAKTLADPEEPASALSCTCTDVDPREKFTSVGVV